MNRVIYDEAALSHIVMACQQKQRDFSSYRTATNMRRSSMRYFSLLLCALLLSSCSSKKNTGRIRESVDKLKIGMTYDDVDKLIGKPSAIERGVHQIKPVDFKDLPLEVLKRVVIYPHEKNDTTISLPIPPEIETVGQFLYVTWVYESELKFSNYCVFSKKEIYRRVPVKRTIYFIDDMQVDKHEYDFRVSIDSESAVKHRTMAVTGMDTVSTVVSCDTVRSDYESIEKYCVIFDASSGRVVEFHFLPYLITEKLK